ELVHFINKKLYDLELNTMAIMNIPNVSKIKGILNKEFTNLCFYSCGNTLFLTRSEERRVGKEINYSCRAYQTNNNCVERENSKIFVFFVASRRRHTRFSRDWSSDVCSSDLELVHFINKKLYDLELNTMAIMNIPNVSKIKGILNKEFTNLCFYSCGNTLFLT